MDFIYCYFVVIKFTGSHSGNGLHSFVFRPPLIKYKRELIPIAVYIEVTIEDTHTHNLTLHKTMNSRYPAARALHEVNKACDWSSRLASIQGVWLHSGKKVTLGIYFFAQI